jgi:MFS transporter, AAHS family, 3-hydroxyphenylpropionic acid transporter
MRLKHLDIFVAPLANLIPSMIVATLGIALREVSHTLSLSALEAGSLFSAIFVSASIGSAIGGRLSDKIGRKTVMVLGVLLLSLGFFIAGYAATYAFMTAFLAVTGIGYGFTTPSLYALMADLLPERRGLGATLVSVTYGIGVSAGAVLASFILARVHWQIAFVAVGLFGFLIAGVEALALKNARRDGAHARVRYRDIFNRQIFILAVAEFFGGSVFWSSASWTATVLRTAKGLNLAETGFVMGLWGLTPMIGALFLGPLSDKVGRRAVILYSAFPAALAAFVSYQWLASPLALAIGLMIFGILKASVPTLIVPLAQESASPDAAGAAAGIIMSMHYVSAVVAPLVTAALITETRNMILAMILTAVIPLIIYGCLIATVREKPHE